ncbi:MAG: hypothetical protein KKB78_17870, partial [Alphaproteobacteria bacterium]|nr:hypothetical protein [Alphaproteobacteria bacterium]
SSYNWPPLLETYEFDVVNDCGTRDLILCLSQCFVIGMGMAGRNGFKTLNGGRVTNRYFKGGHSLYFRDKRSHSDKFMRTYWLDLLIPSVKASIIDPRKSGLLLTRRSKVSDIMREWTKKLMQENYP